MKFRFLQNSRSFSNSRAIGDRFSPTLQNVAIIKVFYWYFWSFQPESRFYAKKLKFREIPRISSNSEEFPEIWWNLINSALLGPLPLPIISFGHLEQLFKAKNVTFWEVSRLFAKVALFAPKTAFSRISGFGAQFPTFLVKSALFRSRASKKPPRTLCL